MSVFMRKGSTKLYFKFWIGDLQVLRSAKVNANPDKDGKPNPKAVRIAEQRETLLRDKMLKQAAIPEGQRPLPPAPTFQDFCALPRDAVRATDTTPAAEAFAGGRFWEKWATSEHQETPNTLAYYTQRMTSLLSYPELAQCRLDKIDTVVLDGLKVWARKKKLGARTINANTAVLRKALRLAQRWKLITTLPEFEELEEKECGRLVTLKEEAAYLAAAERMKGFYLRDIYIMLVDTSIEPGTTSMMPWTDVHFEPTEIDGVLAEFGYVHGRCEKTPKRERDLPMSQRMHRVLKERWMAQGRPSTGYVFPAVRTGKNLPTTLGTFEAMHNFLWKRKTNPLTIDHFRLYDLRHTALTRFVEWAGADIFTLTKIAGWETYEMARRYVHASDRSKMLAFGRLNTHIESRLAAVAVQAVG